MVNGKVLPVLNRSVTMRVSQRTVSMVGGWVYWTD